MITQGIGLFLGITAFCCAIALVACWIALPFIIISKANKLIEWLSYISKQLTAVNHSINERRKEAISQQVRD
jgi:hypothetical protein